MAMLTYDQFLANVQDEDVRLLVAIALENRVVVQTQAEADAIHATMAKLLGPNVLLLVAASHGYEWDPTRTILWHVFEAKINPDAIAYVVRLAMERYKIHRNPV